MRVHWKKDDRDVQCSKMLGQPHSKRMKMWVQCLIGMNGQTKVLFVFGPNQVKIPNKCRSSKQTTMPQNNTGPQHIRPTLRSSINHFNLKGRLYLVCKTWEYLADREIRNESLIWTKAGQHGNVKFCSPLSEFCVIRLTELDSTHVQIGPNLILWFFR